MKSNEQYNGAVLLEMFQRMTAPEIAKATGLTLKTVEYRIRAERVKQGTPPPPRLQASPYPRYVTPLELNGDALVLNDIEVPFHHADFVNRCLDLSQAWGIDDLFLGGDVFHMDTFSAWGAAWTEEKPQVDTISEATEDELRAIAQALPAEQQAALLEKIDRMAANREGASDEMKAGAKALKTLAQVFKGIYYVLGNHDDRFLRRLAVPQTPQSLLNYLGLTDKAFHIAPYFYGVLHSGGEKWRIEHQRGAGLNVAIKLADKNECHTICAHSHLQAFNWSTSGRYYAISSGCACDEDLFAYASTRSNNSPAHKLGAVIIRDGTPWVLNMRTPWERLARM